MKNNVFKVILKWLICAVIIFLGFWFVLPPLNPRSGEMWGFLVFCIIVCVVVNAFSQLLSLFSLFKVDSGIYRINPKEQRRETLKKAGKPFIFAICAVVGIIVLSAAASLIGAQVFNASRYEKLITMENGDFTADVAEINRTQIPVVDRDTASRLGQRKLGEISDLVSQFVIEEDYTQINYKGKPVRVTPLAYGDIIKWFNNNSKGIPAYITVDMTTQETSLVRLDEGIKYSYSEYLMRNLYRYLRFNYPTKIFDNISFEIDEDGTPYWVASTMTFRIGFWSGRDIEGAVLLNAVTGESKYYSLEEIPKWVDQVYSSDMIMEQ